ncbi:MAG: acetyl-CoA carboxylase carboxyl transferase subunit alpha, partial [Alphaproteobacteria bacterium]|nr:acetyl-CoA carboxylase carboxyl transferase subunit alpha [Alphaproteobacteria bacterium]
AAGILWRDGARARDAAMAMKITAPDLLALKIIDRIIPEPVGGAHADPAAAITAVGDALAEELAALSTLSPEQIRKARADRFYAIGRHG